MNIQDVYIMGSTGTMVRLSKEDYIEIKKNKAKLNGKLKLAQTGGKDHLVLFGAVVEKLGEI